MRADVLLVYPPWVTYSFRSKLKKMLPPLGILSMASCLEAQGFEVHVVDCHAREMGPGGFRAIVRRLRPRLVGITVLSPHYVPANYIAAICKEEVPDVTVVTGGVHAEAHPEEMLRNPSIDAVGRGDGEMLMTELARGTAREKIEGLSYRVGDQVVHNPPRKIEMDLDRYPLPAYHLVDFDDYFPPVSSYRDLPAMNVLMTRGCPGKCTFCNSANTTLRSRSVEKMIELLKCLRAEYGIRQIYFYDDTFTVNRRAVLDLCRRMAEEKIDLSWICCVRGDMFNEEMAKALAAAGCHQVMIGIESGSKTLMAAIGKPIKHEVYQRVVEVAHRNRLEVRGSFIIGHVNETKDTLRESLQFAIDLDLDFFQLSVMTPYPGTVIFEQFKSEGRLLHEEYSRYGQNEVVFRLNHLSAEEVNRFERFAFWKFYSRPRAIVKQLKRLRNLAMLRDLAAAFAFFFFERLRRSGHSAEWEKWLQFDLSTVLNPKIPLPEKPRLTFEVRQNLAEPVFH
ncbi:MAG: radical SAM protein [Candidatus Omnitrophica bacterium]|nr:radical SAM protein [Candidatus Omnitrophota bacterium]